jgi:uncharacterized protein
MLIRFRGFKLLLAVALVLCSCSKQSNQGNAIAIGSKSTVHSAVLEEDREIVIYLPPGYPQPDIRYPVVYMLDGDSHFHHASGVVQFLTSSGVTAPLILVGVGNTDRNRDMTPSRSTDTMHVLPTSGGADKFLKFLTGELAAYMKSHYQVGPYKILVGHSFGGLFALHTLISSPESFSAYIAISPSLWWNKRAELDSAKAFFKLHPRLKNSLYMAVGAEGEGMVAAARTFDSVLVKASPMDLRWQFKYMPNENHGSIVHRALYDGLEYTFSPLSRPPETVLLDTSALERHFAALSDELGYKVVASERMVARMGFQFLTQKKPRSAIALFQYNVRRFPDLPDAYDHLVAAYEQDNQLDQAVKYCELGLEKAKQSSSTDVPYFEKNLADIRKRIEKRRR